MACPFDIFRCLIYLFVGTNLLTGCVSYRFMRGTEGREVPSLSEEYLVGETTLGEVLETLGAPDGVVEVEGEDVLVYKRSVVANSGLSFGIPLSDLFSLDFSGTGTLVRYDVLLLFFTPDGVLSSLVREEGSAHPYLRTILRDHKDD